GFGLQSPEDMPSLLVKVHTPGRGGIWKRFVDSETLYELARRSREGDRKCDREMRWAFLDGGAFRTSEGEPVAGETDVQVRPAGKGWKTLPAA
ncbi:MAG: hypothetical protein LBQ12_06230, partial [Deltaproteobacteria bacterium]|nr:hypothetical protein [Deltaproteobacteria bacterium]MDR1313290.1 hypothetical protein [Deltaproteobacteria bacterium]